MVLWAFDRVCQFAFDSVVLMACVGQRCQADAFLVCCTLYTSGLLVISMRCRQDESRAYR